MVDIDGTFPHQSIMFIDLVSVPFLALACPWLDFFFFCSSVQYSLPNESPKSLQSRRRLKQVPLSFTWSVDLCNNSSSECMLSIQACTTNPLLSCSNKLDGHSHPGLHTRASLGARKKRRLSSGKSPVSNSLPFTYSTAPLLLWALLLHSHTHHSQDIFSLSSSISDCTLVCCQY